MCTCHITPLSLDIGKFTGALGFHFSNTTEGINGAFTRVKGDMHGVGTTQQLTKHMHIRRDAASMSCRSYAVQVYLSAQTVLMRMHTHTISFSSGTHAVRRHCSIGTTV